jgi:hypothetical protein
MLTPSAYRLGVSGAPKQAHATAALARAATDVSKQMACSKAISEARDDQSSAARQAGESMRCILSPAGGLPQPPFPASCLVWRCKMLLTWPVQKASSNDATINLNKVLPNRGRPQTPVLQRAQLTGWSPREATKSGRARCASGTLLEYVGSLFSFPLTRFLILRFHTAQPN